MYDEIFELIQNGELNKAQEQLENTPENDPKRYNISGLIYYQKKEFDKAKEEFEKGLKINPVDSDLLFNYGYLLKNINQEKEAWRYLMRIHNKDWATYDLLGDIEYKNRSKLASLRFYKKAAELPNSPNEMKKKFIDMRNIVKQDTKIAFLCLPGLDNFLKDIVETFSLGYDVKLVVTTDGNQIAEAIKWADIVWLEWANEMTVFATNQIPEIQNKKVVCRLHSYEIFTQFPDKINWTNIDQLIFVGDHIKRILHELHPNLNINPDKEIIVSNGVDLDKFKFLVHKPGYNLSVLAHINYKKDPSAWIQIINKLIEIDNRYKMHVGGDFQDPRYKIYFDYIKKEMKLENNFILHGWINEVDKFLEDKDYTLSTSIHESFGYNIAEAMARGIKPVILNYSGAKEQWPNELIYNTIDEAIEKITEQTYDSENYRRFIEDNYSLEKQIDSIEQIMNEKKILALNNINVNNIIEKIKISYCIPVYNSEKFIKKSLESILNQQIKPYEIIIIDDASVDNSYNILKHYSRKYETITLFRNEKNLGAPMSHFQLLSKAKGNFVKIVHADDELNLNYSTEIYKINDIEKYAFIVNDYSHIDTTKNFIIENYLKKRWESLKINPNHLSKEDLQKLLAIVGNYLGTPSNVLFNKECLQKIGFSQEGNEYINITKDQLYNSEVYDFYILLNLLYIGKPLIIFKDLSYRYENDSNITSSYIGTLKEIINLLNTFLKFKYLLNEEEKKQSYSFLLWRTTNSIKNAANLKERKKMIEFVLKNYKYLPKQIEAELLKELEKIENQP